MKLSQLRQIIREEMSENINESSKTFTERIEKIMQIDNPTQQRKLIFQWVKDNKITFKQFEEILSYIYTV